MRPINLDNVQEATDYKKLTAGAYIAKIINVEDNADKGYLFLAFDIIEGEFAGRFTKLYEDKAIYGLSARQSYSNEKSLSFFKSFITAVQNSNHSYKWNNDEKQLIGKRVGIVVGEEEYQANDGTVKIRTYIYRYRSIEAIRKYDCYVPELKKLANTSNNYFKEQEQIQHEIDELPF